MEVTVTKVWINRDGNYVFDLHVTSDGADIPVPSLVLAKSAATSEQAVEEFVKSHVTDSTDNVINTFTGKTFSIDRQSSWSV